MKDNLANENGEMKNPKLKVALVCDWLIGTGGAERVVLELHKMFPDAPIYTSQYNKDPRVWYGDIWFSKADIRTGWLQWFPKQLRKFLPVLRILYFKRLNLSDYDLVISSSGAEAKFILPERKKRQIINAKLFGKRELKNEKSDMKHPLHITYCHAPTHYYWDRYDEYLAAPGFGRLNWLARIGLKLLVGSLRKWDYQAAQNPDYLIANSNHTQQQIKKYYGRDSTVIHPPVDVDRFKLPAAPSQLPTTSYQLPTRHGFITAGRQTPYKKIGLAVAACTNLNLPLIVIGNGPDHRKLQRSAGRSVTFLRKVNDDQIAHYFQTSEAFIFPGIDDFGIVAVEALASGTPVIAFKGGGALDYISANTGEFFEEQTVESLEKALKNFSLARYNSAVITKRAADLSPEKFQQNFQNFIKQIGKLN